MTTPGRDRRIDSVIAALGLHPLYVRLVASAHCDEHAAHRALELIEMAGQIVDLAARGRS